MWVRAIYEVNVSAGISQLQWSSDGPAVSNSTVCGRQHRPCARRQPTSVRARKRMPSNRSVAFKSIANIPAKQGRPGRAATPLPLPPPADVAGRCRAAGPPITHASGAPVLAGTASQQPTYVYKWRQRPCTMRQRSVASPCLPAWTISRGPARAPRFACCRAPIDNIRFKTSI